MGGLLILLVLCVVMALASFFAGALPLSMTLSQSQLRIISSVGVGILVGTSLIVIIPEGIEAVATTIEPTAPHAHTARHVLGRRGIAGEIRWERNTDSVVAQLKGRAADSDTDADKFGGVIAALAAAAAADNNNNDEDTKKPAAGKEGETKHGHDEVHMPTFSIGFSLILGFALMFLIDRLPQHATESLQGSTPATRHISLDNLETSSVNGTDVESEGFLTSLTPSPKQSRSLATTTGLVIHAAADGIAMGASATTSNTKLGFIIFVAIMVHKAPAAFGLTSVLLKQGLSKRAARGHLIVFSLAAPVGALGTYFLVSVLGGGSMEGESGQWWTGMLLLFSAGTFLYVAMHAMQEDSAPGGVHEHHIHSAGMNGYADNSSVPQRRQAKPQMRDTLATVVGMLLPLLTQFGHHH